MDGVRRLFWVAVAPLLALYRLVVGGWVDSVRRRRRIGELLREMKTCGSYERWSALAKEVDSLRGVDGWRLDPHSPFYDYRYIEAQLTRLRETRNIHELIHHVRQSLVRNFAGTANPALFAHSLVGTKTLVENFIQEMDNSLREISSSAEIALEGRIEIIANMRKIYGRSALLLSGGATLGMYHLGVLKGLWETGMMPRIFSGSSAGSLVASLVCGKTDEELPRFFDPASLNLQAIERQGDHTAQRRLTRLLKTGYFFDIRVLQECIRDNGGDLTFLEAYNKTRRILNITVSSANSYEAPLLLNYMTAPHVLIWSAASASSAIPGVYEPVSLMAKNKAGETVPWDPSGSPHVDGSVQSDLPMKRLAELFNVNHFIVSQVNPHIAPFLRNRPTAPTALRSLAWAFIRLVRNECEHRVYQIGELNILPSSLRTPFYWVRALLNQQYTGDITIVPPVRLSDYGELMSNPSVAGVRRKAQDAERATWELLPMIQMHCRLERTLDTLLYELRVERLARLGRTYRPLDFALDVPEGGSSDDDDEAEEADLEEGENSQPRPLPRERAEAPTKKKAIGRDQAAPGATPQPKRSAFPRTRSQGTLLLKAKR